MPQVTEDARKRLKAWVAAGGTLVLGPLTGFRSAEFTAFTDQVFGGFENLMGATSALRFTTQWVEDRVKIAFNDGHEATVRTWAEAFAPDSARVMATWKGGYGDGLPALIDNTYGKGRVITIGAVTDGESYAKVLDQACRDAGLAPLVTDAPAKAIVIPRANDHGDITGWGVCNNSEEPVYVTLPSGGTDVLGKRDFPDGVVKLEPWDVALVKTQG